MSKSGANYLARVLEGDQELRRRLGKPIVAKLTVWVLAVLAGTGAPSEVPLPIELADGSWVEKQGGASLHLPGSWDFLGGESAVFEQPQRQPARIGGSADGAEPCTTPRVQLSVVPASETPGTKNAVAEMVRAILQRRAKLRSDGGNAKLVADYGSFLTLLRNRDHAAVGLAKSCVDVEPPLTEPDVDAEVTDFVLSL